MMNNVDADVDEDDVKAMWELWKSRRVHEYTDGFNLPSMLFVICIPAFHPRISHLHLLKVHIHLHIHSSQPLSASDPFHLK